MRKHCSNVCELHPGFDTESTNSARTHSTVTAALRWQHSQTELVFWIALVMAMLGLLIAEYLQFVMLGELKKRLGIKRKCLCSKTTTVLLEEIIQKMYDVGPLHIYCIIHKYTV